MPKFEIWYTETYGKEYIVEAESYIAARNKLYDDIFNGRIDGPEECVDSSIEYCSKIKEDKDGSN